MRLTILSSNLSRVIFSAANEFAPARKIIAVIADIIPPIFIFPMLPSELRNYITIPRVTNGAGSNSGFDKFAALIRFRVMEAASEARLSLRPGTEQEIHAILSGSRQVWGAGISLEDYVQYHSLIRHHAWSKTHFQHLVLTDDQGGLFSSCKVYHHKVRVKDEICKIAGVGAVFTPASFRSKGYARQMLESVLDQLRESGCDLVMLFSDIGPEFYARLNFRVIRKYDPVYAFLSQKIRAGRNCNL